MRCFFIYLRRLPFILLFKVGLLPSIRADLTRVAVFSMSLIQRFGDYFNGVKFAQWEIHYGFSFNYIILFVLTIVVESRFCGLQADQIVREWGNCSLRPFTAVRYEFALVYSQCLPIEKILGKLPFVVCEFVGERDVFEELSVLELIIIWILMLYYPSCIKLGIFRTVTLNGSHWHELSRTWYLVQVSTQHLHGLLRAVVWINIGIAD